MDEKDLDYLLDKLEAEVENVQHKISLLKQKLFRKKNQATHAPKHQAVVDQLKSVLVEKNYDDVAK